MSRKINIEEPLSEDDRAYLLARWDVTALRRNMQHLGVEQSVANRAENMSHEEYEDALSQAENADDTSADQTPNPNAGTGSTPTPASVTAQQQQGVGLGAQSNDPTPYTEGPRAFADPELAGKAYDKWNADQLKAEVAKRNELRQGVEAYADDEPLSADGTKADIAQRLTEDDEADAPE